MAWIALTAGALAVVLAAEYRGVRQLIMVAKPIASVGFIAAALSAGALDSGYGQAVLAALVLSWFGDVFLIPKDPPWFLLGLVSFLLGHVGYCVAFLVVGIDVTTALVALVPMLGAAIVVARWLLPSVPDRLYRPVIAYVVVITAMAVLSFGAWTVTEDWRIPFAAVLFFLSDLTVARDRFVAKDFLNRLVGLPLYYAAQLVFAWTLIAL